MAQQFNLTAQINLQSPKNVGKVVSDIQRQLKGSGLNTVNIKVKADPRSMAQTNRQLQNVSKNSRAASKDINTLNRSLQEATRRFSVITIATGTLLSLVTGFKNATKAAIEFERELVKISQVTGKSVQQLQGLTKEVTRLSTAFGVSSADLLNVSRTLAQAGFNAEKTRKSLDILAKTTLAATFDNIQDTTEGAIALLRQFGNEAKRTGGDVAFLEKSLSAINSVSKQFAVESGDLITVIRRVGGVFSSAGGSVNELIALFTSVRATTRESAETIATGLRTIFTRIQRTDTIDQLKALNIQLQDSQGRFVGAFEAVKRLSEGLATIDPREARFSKIVEELGGFRQVGKVIPLIQQFATAQQALTVAQNASGSVAKDAATAQQGLGVQIQKVREEFTALIRKFTDSGPFNTIATGALKIASAMIKVAEAVEPLLPLLTTMFGLKLGKALAPGVASLAGIARSGGRTGGGGFSKFARGGMVPGSGNRDTVPAMLTPGEFVIKKSSVKKLGAGTLAQMNNNRYAAGGIARQKSVGIAVPDIINSSLQPKTGSVDVSVDEVLSKKVGFGELASKSIKDIYGISAGIKGTKRQNLEAKGKKSITALRDIAKKEFGFSSRSFSTLAEGVGTDEKKEFDTIVTEESKKLISNSVQRFGKVAGVGLSGNEVKFSPKYAVSQAQKGNIFEEIITAFNGQPLAGEASEQNRPFDFTDGIKTNRLFEALASIKYIDAKISGGANIAAGEFKKKTTGQLAFELSKSPLLTAGRKFASGGGVGGSDTVPAMLTPGEFVFNKSAAKSIGYGNLNRMNKKGVQGFAKGGPVGFENGGPVLPINPGTQSGGALAAMKASGIFEGLEQLATSSEKNTKTTEKNNKTTEKNNTIRAKTSKAMQGFSQGLKNTKAGFQGFVGGLASGAERLQRITGSAQSFVFLTASIGAVTSQMSGLENATKKAINETAAFASGIVGIGATLVDTIASVIISMNANTIANNVNTTSEVGETGANIANTASEVAETGANVAAAIASVVMSGPFLALAAIVGGAILAVKFYNSRLRAEAEELGKIASELRNTINQGEGTQEDVRRTAASQIQAAANLDAQIGAGERSRSGVDETGGIRRKIIGTRQNPMSSFGGRGGVGGLQEVAIIETTEEFNKRVKELNQGIVDSIVASDAAAKANVKFAETVNNIDTQDFLPAKEQIQLRVEASRASADQLDSDIAGGIGQQLVEIAAANKTTVSQLRTLEKFEGGDRQRSATENLFGGLNSESQLLKANIANARKAFELAQTEFLDGTKSFDELNNSYSRFGGSLTILERAIQAEAESRKRLIQPIIDELQAKDSLNKTEQQRLDDLTAQRNKIDAETQKELTRTKDSARRRGEIATAELAATQASIAAIEAFRKQLEEQNRALSTIAENRIRAERDLQIIEDTETALSGGSVSLRARGIDAQDFGNIINEQQFRSQVTDVIASAVGTNLEDAVKNAGQRVLTGAAAIGKFRDRFLNQNFNELQNSMPDGSTINDMLFGTNGILSVFNLSADKQTDILAKLSESEQVIGQSDLGSIISNLEEILSKDKDILNGQVDLNQLELDLRKANFDKIRKTLEEESAFRQSLVDQQERAAENELKARELLARSVGDESVIRINLAKREARRVAKAQADLQAGGVDIGAGDVGGLTAERKRLANSIKQLTKDIDDEDLKNLRGANIDAREKEIIQLGHVTRELERLAAQSDRVSDLFTAMNENIKLIEQERQKREQATRVVEEFVIGGQSTRKSLVEAAQGVRFAFASGTLQNQSEEQRKNTISILDKLADVPLLQGFTGKEIKQELIFRDAIKLGLDPQIAQALATATTKEQQLIDSNELLAFEINKLAQEMQGAQAGLNLAGGLATGGLVQYRAGGGTIFKPKGTDTVPAMLTPGEFVIRKSAVDAIGADNLAAINDGASYFHYGGDVGKHKHPHLDRDVQDGRYARGLAPRSASESLTYIKDQMTPLSPAPPPLRDRDPHIIDMINTPDEFSRDLSGIPFTHRDYGKTGGLQLEDPNAIHKQNLKASAKTTANIAKEFGSDFAGRSGSVFGAVGSELSDFVSSGTIGIMQSLGTDGFAEPQVGPFRSTKGTTVLAQLANDRQQLEDYSQTQQFVGKAAAELFEGGRSPTLGSGLMRGLDELSDFIAGDRQGTRAAERQRIDRQYMGVGQANEQRRFGGDVASPGGLGPSERKLQDERDLAKSFEERKAFDKKQQSAIERHKGYTAQAQKEGKLVFTRDDDGFPNYQFQKSMTDAQLKLIVEGKDYNTGELRENPQGGTDFWLAAQARDELYKREIAESDRQAAERQAAVDAANAADALERKQKEEAIKARDKALGIDKLDLETFEGRMEAAKRRVRAAKEAEAAAEQQKASAEPSSPSDLPKAKAAEREAEKAVKDATKAQTEAKQQQQAASALASGAEPSSPSDLPKPDAQSKQPEKDKAAAAQKAAKAGSEFNILWYRRNAFPDEVIAAQFPNSYEAQRLKGTNKPLPRGFDLSKSPELVPFSAEEQRVDADTRKQFEEAFLPEGVTTDDVRESLGKNQGQGGSSIGSFLSALGSSVFSNAKDFLSRTEDGDKFVGPLDTRSRRQKARDRRFGRRGIESRSQRGTPTQLARRQQEAGVELDPNNPINKARYERILRTQGPAAAQRFANYSGYEPPQGLPGRGRGITQSFRNRPNMMGTPQAMQQFQNFQQYQQFLRFQQQNNRGGIRSRGASRFATGGGVSGADTVPAMLTPGEFVMSAGAVRQHGVGTMRALNRGQISGFNRGGMVGGVQYRQNGGFMNALGGAAQSLGFDTSGITETFDNFVGNFSSTFDNITKTFGGIASTISELANSFGNFTMTHQVVISGIPDVDSNALANQVADKLAGVVVEKVKGAFEQQGKDYNPPGGN